MSAAGHWFAAGAFLGWLVTSIAFGLLGLAESNDSRTRVLKALEQGAPCIARTESPVVKLDNDRWACVAGKWEVLR